MPRYKYINMVQVKKKKKHQRCNELKYRGKKKSNVRKYKEILTYLNKDTNI